MHISLWVSFIQVVSASGGSFKCPILDAILDCKPVLSEWYQLLKEAASVHVTIAWISRYLINEAWGAFADGSFLIQSIQANQMKDVNNYQNA